MNLATAIIMGFIYRFGNLLGLYGAYILHELGLM